MTTTTCGSDAAPTFDDEATIAFAASDTHLPEQNVRKIFAARFWYRACAGLVEVEGHEALMRLEQTRQQYAFLFEDDEPHTHRAEADYVTQVTGIAANEATLALLSLRTSEAHVGNISWCAVADYRGWRARWLAMRAQPSTIWFNDRSVSFTFEDAPRREDEIG